MVTSNAKEQRMKKVLSLSSLIIESLTSNYDRISDEYDLTDLYAELEGQLNKTNESLNKTDESSPLLTQLKGLIEKIRLHELKNEIFHCKVYKKRGSEPNPIYLYNISSPRDQILVKYANKCHMPRGLNIVFQPRTNKIELIGFYPKFENDLRQRQGIDLQGIPGETTAFYYKYSGSLIMVWKDLNGDITVTSKTSAIDFAGGDKTGRIQNAKKVILDCLRDNPNLEKQLDEGQFLGLEYVSPKEQVHGAEVGRETLVAIQYSTKVVIEDGVQKSGAPITSLGHLFPHQPIPEDIFSGALTQPEHITTKLDPKPLILAINRERDFLRADTLTALLADHLSDDVTFTTGPIKHAAISGDVLEGFVITVNTKNGPVKEKLKLPYYNYRTFLMRSFIQNVMALEVEDLEKTGLSKDAARTQVKFTVELATKHAKLFKDMTDSYVRLWVVTPEGREFWKHAAWTTFFKFEEALEKGKHTYPSVGLHILAADLAMDEIKERGDERGHFKYGVEDQSERIKALGLQPAELIPETPEQIELPVKSFRAARDLIQASSIAMNGPVCGTVLIKQDTGHAEALEGQAIIDKLMSYVPEEKRLVCIPKLDMESAKKRMAEADRAVQELKERISDPEFTLKEDQKFTIGTRTYTIKTIKAPIRATAAADGEAADGADASATKGRKDNPTIVIKGLSGSGKTILAKALAEKYNAVTASADIYFRHTGGFDTSKLGHAHGWCQATYAAALLKGESVIVDNTNPSYFEQTFYGRCTKLPLTADRPFVVIEVDARPEDIEQSAWNKEQLEKKYELFESQSLEATADDKSPETYLQRITKTPDTKGGYTRASIVFSQADIWRFKGTKENDEYHVTLDFGKNTVANYPPFLRFKAVERLTLEDEGGRLSCLKCEEIGLDGKPLKDADEKVIYRHITLDASHKKYKPSDTGLLVTGELPPTHVQVLEDEEPIIGIVNHLPSIQRKKGAAGGKKGGEVKSGGKKGGKVKTK